MDARSTYRETATRGASPVRLVICLYEQAIEDLRKAVIAQEKGDIEARTRGINHALMVVAQLQGSLDMLRGGDVAKNLARFYSVVRAGLLDAQVQQSTRILAGQIAQLATVHEAWLEVERIATLANFTEPAPSAPVNNSPSSRQGWNA
jgi:flagellar protein FliS